MRVDFVLNHNDWLVWTLDHLKTISGVFHDLIQTSLETRHNLTSQVKLNETRYGTQIQK